MDAKKLTLAVSFMMVLAAAFVLVVPSDSEADDVEFDITDAQFIKGTTNYALKVTISKTVDKGTLFLYYEDQAEPMIERDIPSNKTTLPVVIGPTLADGTYSVVVTSEYGTVSETLTWPPIVEYGIIVTQSVGGHVETDVSSAVPKTIVNITATPDDDYNLKQIIVNGKILEKGVFSFEMPDSPVSVSAVFEKQLCTVTFVVAEGFSKEVTATVGAPMQAPEDPEVIGAEFEGWYTEDGVKFDFETEIEGDMTLYAHFGPITPEKAATAVFIGATQTGDAKLRVTIDADEGYVPAGKITGKIAFAYQKEILPGVMVWETGYSDIEEITVTNEGQYELFVGYIDLVAEHIEYANNFQLSYEVDGKVIGQTAKIEYASA